MDADHRRRSHRTDRGGDLVRRAVRAERADPERHDLWADSRARTRGHLLRVMPQRSRQSRQSVARLLHPDTGAASEPRHGILHFLRDRSRGRRDPDEYRLGFGDEQVAAERVGPASEETLANRQDTFDPRNIDVFETLAG